jgi:hypothetical protein
LTIPANAVAAIVNENNLQESRNTAISEFQFSLFFSMMKHFIINVLEL